MFEKYWHINTFFLLSSISFLFWITLSNLITSTLICVVVIFFVSIFLLNYLLYNPKSIYFCLAIIIFFAIGIAVSQTHLEHINTKESFISSHSSWGKKYIEWKITDVHKVSDFSIDYEIQLYNIQNTDKTTLHTPTKTTYGIISIPRNFTINKWDIIATYESIKSIENFASGFNYKKYMASQKYFFKIRAQSINNVWREDPHVIIDNIDTIREVLLQKIELLYPKEEGMFLGWILLWARENLPDDLKDDFNASGLTHFIAVSWFNITILVVFLSFVLKVFPVTIRILGITVCIAAFTLLVWDAAPVVRAAIMGLLAYYILVSGREVHTLSLLLLVAVIMVIWSPLILTYDVSFHLSFLAVLWILYTQDFFKKMFHFLPETLAIREAFVLTLSAMAFALPVMIFNFGQLSLLSPFANIAVTWTIPIAMLFWFLSLIVDFFSHTLWIWLSYFTWIFLAWDIKVVHFFGWLDWAIMKTDFWIYKHSLQILYFSLLIFVINYFQTDEVQNNTQTNNIVSK